MRLALSLLLTLFASLLIPSDAHAQLDLPIADYSGSLQLELTCPDGTVTKLKTKGEVSINSQVGGNVMASAEFTGKRAGVACTVSLDMTGIVNSFGRVVGTYSSTIACIDGTTTTGSGEFDGRYTPGRLAFLIDGMDDACALAGDYKGKGSPGTALCAALTHATISKFSKKFFAAYSRSFKTAHLAISGVALQQAILRAQSAFNKGIAKAAKKSGKAGGACSKPPTPAANMSNKLKVDIIDPMKVGFQANRPLDRFARSRIAKMQGQYMAARLKAESLFIMKLDPVKRAASLEKARDAFVTKSTDLLTQVSEKGLVWTGAGPQAMAQDIEDLTAFLVVFFE